MPAYRIISENTELPRDTRITAIDGTVKPGDLAAFELPAGVVIGRWYPDILGSAWIIQPERAIALTLPYHVIGVVEVAQ